MSKAGPGFVSKKVVPILLTTALTFNVLASPFLKAQVLDSTISKRTPQEKVETARKPLTIPQQAGLILKAVRQEMSILILSEPALATLPPEEISKLLDALSTPARSKIPIMLKLSKTMYGPDGRPIVAPNGQYALREHVELQNALLRLSSTLLFEWGIDRLDVVVAESANLADFQIFIGRSEPFPAPKQLIESAEKKGLLK